MSADIARCKQCKTPLDEAALGGLCPRCLALDFFSPGPDGGQEKAIPSFSAGEHRIGDYELLEEIARGGMGVVYRARQASLGREVAVKMILEGVLAGETAIARFKAEAAAAAGLLHANIVAIHEISKHQGRHYFSMEFVRGRTLADLVREGPLTARLAAKYVERIADAVHYAHGQGILHRDLKPSNIIIDQNDQPRITDFGLAKRLTSPSDSELRTQDLTLTGQVLGTPAYMSPEQAGGAKFGIVDSRSDVYSLGALLYHLVTGRAPFTGATATEILRQVTDVQPVAPRLLRPSVPRDLETICLKCLEKEPSRRYQSAAGLAGDLARLLADKSIHARPVSAFEHGWRWCRRKPALAASLTGMGLLLISIAASSTLSARRIEHLRREGLTNLYAADMRLAQQAIAEGKFGVASGLLERHRPARGDLDLRGFEWRYFWDQCRSDEVATLGKHEGQAQRAVFSSDGRLIATGALDARVWDVTTRRLLFSLPCQEYIRALAFSPDGRRLAVGENEGGLHCFELEAGREVARRPPPGPQPFALQWPTAASEVLLWAQGRCAVWDFASTALRDRCPLPAGSSRATVSDNGLFVTLQRTPARLEVWRSNQLVVAYPVGGLALSAAVSKDGTRFAAGEYGGALDLFELAPMPRTNRFPAHRGLINALAFAADGQRVASGGADQVIRLWDTATGRRLNELRGHRRALWALAFSPDGDWLVSGDMDGVVKLWHTRTNRHEFTAAQGYSATLSEDGAAWTLGNTNGVWMYYATAPDGPGLQLDSQLADLLPVCVASTNGLICGRPGGSLMHYGPDLRRQTVTLPPVLTNSLMCLSPDGRFVLYSVPETKATAAWDIVASRRIWELGDASWRALTISRNSQFVALGAFAGGLRVWELATGREIRALAAHTAAAYAADFSPDGTRVVSAGLDGAVKFWEIGTGRLLGEFRSSVESYWTVALSPDGRRIAAGTSESSIVLWDVMSRQEVATFQLGEPLGPVQGMLRFSPDGASLLQADGHLRRWYAPPPPVAQ